MGTLTAGIKEIFSAAKTTGSNVMLCGNDGTPDGHMTMANLASVLGGLSNSRFYFVDANNQTVQDLVKNVVANNKGLNRYTFWGGCQLYVQGFYIMHVYETDAVDNDGLPRYASGIAVLQGELHHFHVANYVFNDRML